MPTPGQEPNAQDSARSQACFDKITALGYHQRISYHPNSAFWTLQWRETGLMLAAAALLSALAFWRIRQDV
ncbi:hypothetical protein [Kineosporia sp. NBRC 101731]|uniref:hypothetical protein n=1 Tax=Kineosporia sp. NBRC 101731 TaxID=3032199 RepID=UPI002555B12C|nr:hypothetical protein [Kineosporia sp. NBRC 101731]